MKNSMLRMKLNSAVSVFAVAAAFSVLLPPLANPVLAAPFNLNIPLEQRGLLGIELTNDASAERLAGICFLPDCGDDILAGGGDINMNLNEDTEWCEKKGYTYYATGQCPQYYAQIGKCSRDEYYLKCDAVTWCKQNGYNTQSCSLPSFVNEQCPNGKPYYKGCKEDRPRACREQGYVNSCSPGRLYVSSGRCPWDSSYGTCCNAPQSQGCPTNYKVTCDASRGSSGKDTCEYTCYRCCSDECSRGSKNYSGSYASTTECGTSCYYCKGCTSGSTSYSGSYVGSSECGSCYSCSDSCNSGSKSVSCSSTENRVRVSSTECGTSCYSCQYNSDCSVTSKSCSYGCASTNSCGKCTSCKSAPACTHGSHKSCSYGCASTCSCCSQCTSCKSAPSSGDDTPSTPSHSHSYSCPSGYSTSSSSCSNGYTTASKTCSCGSTSGTCYKCNSAPSHSHSYSCPSGYQSSPCSSGYTQKGTTSKKCSCGSTSGTCYKCEKVTHSHSYSCPSGYQSSSCSSGYTQKGTTSKKCSCGSTSGTCYKCEKNATPTVDCYAQYQSGLKACGWTGSGCPSDKPSCPSCCAGVDGKYQRCLQDNL